MVATADKFSRLAALKPTRPIPARPAAIRIPDEADSLGRLLGAGVARNHFGEHLAVRNWFSTPEFTDPSSTTLELLSRTRDESLSRKTRAALQNPEKWLFLDTETTGLAGGTGTYAFLIGLAWWDAGGLQIEQFLMRDFTEEYSILHELAERAAERPVLVTFNGKSFDWPLRQNSRRILICCIPRARCGSCGSVRCGSWNWNVTSLTRPGWAGIAKTMWLRRLFPSITSTICAAGRPSRLLEWFATIRWICAGSPLSSAKSTRCFLSRPAP